MAGVIGTQVADEDYNFLYRGTVITIGANLWIRFLVTPSSRSGGGTETNYGGYARYQHTRGTGGLFGAPSSGGRLANTVELALPAPSTLGNGDLVWFDFVDTASGAFTKQYNGGPVSPAKAIEIGKPPTCGPNKLVMTL